MSDEIKRDDFLDTKLEKFLRENKGDLPPVSPEFKSKLYARVQAEEKEAMAETRPAISVPQMYSRRPEPIFFRRLSYISFISVFILITALSFYWHKTSLRQSAEQSLESSRIENYLIDSYSVVYENDQNPDNSTMPIK